MFTKLKKIIFGDTRPIRPAVIHPIIGHLVYSDDDEAWLTDPRASAYGFGFYISGDWSHPGPEVVPPPQLLERAAEIAAHPEIFTESVRQFIESQLKTVGSLKNDQSEIERLRIYRVLLMWPERPTEGEIELRTSLDSNRMWHCAYLGGKPAPHLVFSGIDDGLGKYAAANS